MYGLNYNTKKKPETTDEELAKRLCSGNLIHDELTGVVKDKISNSWKIYNGDRKLLAVVHDELISVNDSKMLELSRYEQANYIVKDKKIKIRDINEEIANIDKLQNRNDYLSFRLYEVEKKNSNLMSKVRQQQNQIIKSNEKIDKLNQQIILNHNNKSDNDELRIINSNLENELKEVKHFFDKKVKEQTDLLLEHKIETKMLDLRDVIDDKDIEITNLKKIASNVEFYKKGLYGSFGIFFILLWIVAWLF